MKRLVSNQRGQVFALTAVVITSCLAMSAFVLDVGAWFREQRHTQQVADASALAGAQGLPGSPGQAQALALQYANSKNAGSVSPSDIILSSYALSPDDTIQVTARSSSPSFFAKVLGFGNVDISSTATARAYVMSKAKYSGPFGIDRRQPELVCGPPCYGPGNDATLDLAKVGPGSFKILEIDGSKSGVGNQTLADWIRNGYNGYEGLGWTSSDTGAKFNDSLVDGALSDQIGQDLLFPVYDDVQSQGTNFQYEVVGWATFHLTGYSVKGNCAKKNDCILTGYFVSVVWEGVDGGDPGNYFGTPTIKLVG